MPKINLYEQDLTTAGGLDASNNIVYVPGFARYINKKYNDPNSKDYIATWPYLFRSVSEFTNVFSNDKGAFEYLCYSVETITDDNNIVRTALNLERSMQYALAILQSGFPVLYDLLNTPDGDGTISEADCKTAIGGITTNLENLKEKNIWDIKFITTGGYENISNGLYSTMLSVAAARGDCTALIDHDDYSDYSIDKIIKLKENYANGKFGAMFTPWCVFQFPSYEKFNVTEWTNPPYLKETSMPGSLAYLLAFAGSVANNNANWLAAAGANRGTIPYLIAPKYNLKESEIDKLQLTETNYTGTAINPIATINPYGAIIWGNRTLHQSGTGLIASNFLNIRQLCNDIKKTLYTACKGVTFEQNSDILWLKFKSMITPLLDRMQTGEGISGYQITKKKSIQKATLTAVIRIFPIEAVENFEITLELADDLTNITDNLQ